MQDSGINFLLPPSEFQYRLTDSTAFDMISLILSIVINDITPWLDIKVAAALCHRTQHAMFLRNSGAPSVPAMVWKTESFHIWQGPLPGDLSDSIQSA
jgi:hypothetical protein